jgi:large subunit ribosomal protein L9
MRVLLTKDVEKLGRAGEIKDVSGGYGRNFLLPKGMAVVATPGQIRQAEERLKAQQRRDEANRKDAEALASRINGVTLTFVARASDEGRLFGSVTNNDVAEKLSARLGAEIDRRKVELEDPIKRTGSYTVAVRLMAGLAPTVTVVVEPEGGAPVPPPLVDVPAATDEPAAASDEPAA